ncbi:hypothetical protein [Streptomyces pseudovenezuelae]|uniref:HNH endonuclease n=1 Tax=Streptomyces pseudovenezuelae TaxID=67350 RepID=UPI0032AF534C
MYLLPTWCYFLWNLRSQSPGVHDQGEGSAQPQWVRLMAMRKRKTLVVCEQCHQEIHAGRGTATTRK